MQEEGKKERRLIPRLRQIRLESELTKLIVTFLGCDFLLNVFNLFQLQDFLKRSFSNRRWDIIFFVQILEGGKKRLTHEMI